MDHKSLVWLGSHSSAIEYLTTLDRAADMADRDPTVMQAGPVREEQERFGDYGDFIQAINNVAVVPINGSMMANESWLSRMFGIMTYDTLSNILAEISADGGIDTVVLDVDSPGGEAKGLDVATDAIAATRDAGIRVVSHTAGQMASAAYWIGSAAEIVAASETAEVGSVGVIGVHMEESKRNQKEGLTYTVLRKGDQKALASPYEPLTDKARAQIEDSMERKYQQFIGAVSEQRGLPREFVSEKIATGQVFSSQEATELGMVDEIIAYNDLVSRYVQSDQTGTAGAGANNWSEAAMHKKPIINAGGISPEEAAIAVAAGANVDDVVPQIKAEGEGEEAEAGDEPAAVEVVDGKDHEEEEAAAEPAAAGEAAPEVDESATAGGFKVVAELTDKLVDAKVQLGQLSAELTALKAGNAGLRQIAIEQTQRLRVSLGMPDDVQDLELMSDASLVTAHRQNLTQFLERFNIGATSSVPEKDPTPAATVTRLHNAALKATSFK
jgi:signal peptide peptidase SppA